MGQDSTGGMQQPAPQAQMPVPPPQYAQVGQQLGRYQTSAPMPQPGDNPKAQMAPPSPQAGFMPDVESQAMKAPPGSGVPNTDPQQNSMRMAIAQLLARMKGGR